jgi:hypothetical protein
MAIWKRESESTPVFAEFTAIVPFSASPDPVASSADPASIVAPP